MTSISSAPRHSLLRQLIWPSLFTAACAAILLSLGVWQLHRLAWKEALIAAITARADAPPANLPAQSEWAKLKPMDYDYRHVAVSGHYLYADTVLEFTPAGPQGVGPGYLLLTPMRLASGGLVIVNRGFAPSDLALKLRERAETGNIIRVTGLMRPPETRGLFTPPDEPDKDEYFTGDPAEIAANEHLPSVAPFLIDADAKPGSTAWPRGGTTERDLPNNHLNYALTWFGLALGLFGVFAAFLIKKIKENRSP
ncbi:MAG TPA: SURF1 family protein [Methylovirgula sp.]